MTIIRDFIGSGSYFTFHQLTMMYYTPEGKTRHEVT